MMEGTEADVRSIESWHAHVYFDVKSRDTLLPLLFGRNRPEDDILDGDRCSRFTCASGGSLTSCYFEAAAGLSFGSR